MKPLVLTGAVALTLLAACTVRGPAAGPDPESPRIMAATPDRSTMYLYAVDGGFIVVDLGWIDAEQRLSEKLSAAGGSPADVVAVLLTHSHRDHIAAWRLVRHAPFYMGAAEVDRFFGVAEHGGFIPRVSDRMLGAPGPAPGAVAVRPLGGDTVLTFGRDTVHAFHVPGHTAGSMVYLLRGMLHAGDAIYRGYIGDFRPAMIGYSDDSDEAARALALLIRRLEPFAVDSVCTAHARCSPFTAELRARLLAHE